MRFAIVRHARLSLVILVMAEISNRAKRVWFRLLHRGSARANLSSAATEGQSIGLTPKVLIDRAARGLQCNYGASVALL
jgi:hypothetical protein